MSILFLVLFCKGLTRNPENKNTPPEFCPISADWGDLQIPNLAGLSLIKNYLMLKNNMLTAFTVPKFFGKNIRG